MDYRATLNLPATDFPMRANLAEREPALLKRWQEEGLYARMQEDAAALPRYILHDGPPYANGHIHLGTAFNKVLKDIILKSKRLAGFNCPYVPGWDCHGLPIEHNVDKELGARKRELSRLEIRQACRRYAGKWIDAQREEFVRLGVLGDWDRPYLTLDFSYEAAIAREFNRFLIGGGVIQSKKPVYWCASCRTALAEAEVEYHDHASPSIYVAFPFKDGLGDLDPALAGIPAFLVIWTTTPWTLPANQAVALHPDARYAVVRHRQQLYVMAAERVSAFGAESGMAAEDFATVGTFAATLLAGRLCRHPFLPRTARVILADYVTMDTGTGCVHIAPGHGREDYISGMANGLEVLSPVDDSGRLTAEAGPYAGLAVKDANRPICDDLKAGGRLLHESQVSHSYPHCWRCKKPVIFRATPQWFISMEENELRARALAAIRTVGWTPRWGEERIRGMVEARPDWCLSRQRVWGVPLTVFVCEDCGGILKDDAVAARIVGHFEQEGADAWFARGAGDFLGAATACASCGGKRFRKEEDILDVWFDSGVSFAAVLEARDNLRFPADLYLEGSDQHRGWFQSALLAAVGTRGVPPYKSVLTHGFVVDGQGKKMSKSVGNVIAPSEVIGKYGAEILRLWVASEDYREDVKVSGEILGQLADAYRKIRNTIRFLLGNLAGFRPQTDRVAPEEMEELDRWALHSFEILKATVMEAYERFEFHAVFHAVLNFCGVTLSALYLDIVKDRLYVSHPDDGARRAAQTVIYDMADGLLRLLAPVLSFTAAEAWDYLPAGEERPPAVFLARFQPLRPELQDGALDERWRRLWAVRAVITRALEIARREKVIGHPLEAEVLVTAPGELKDFLEDSLELLRTIAIVSAVILVEEAPEGAVGAEDMPGLLVLVRPAAGDKCQRCWCRSTGVGADVWHADTCGRCAAVLRRLAAAGGTNDA